MKLIKQYESILEEIIKEELTESVLIFV